jgi:hypothetical protein
MDRHPNRPDQLAPARLVDGGHGGLAERLERWAANARVDEAARARSRERWLRRQAEEEGTLAGVLADLLEAGTPVTVHTWVGGRYGGTVRAVGADFAALAPAGGREREVVVALESITSVRTRPGAPVVVGDRATVGWLHLVDVVASLAAEREQVRVVTAEGVAVTGVVRSVGQDVAVVGGVGDPPAAAYVPVAAISELLIG